MQDCLSDGSGTTLSHTGNQTSASLPQRLVVGRKRRSPPAQLIYVGSRCLRSPRGERTSPGVLEDSKQILVAANMQPDDPFPMDDKIKEAYSHVVENTAFFGDVALRFPRIVHHYYDRNSDWDGLLRWGLNFCNRTGVFTGGAHQHVLTLMSQELGITEKSPDFINPYRTERDDVLHTAEAFQKILREEEKRRRKEEKRKEIRKGPRISRSRTEL
uniref:Coiled-coil domain containing 134 n=1 Tax=Gasterosteus aculeatus aculeatus TaxID=481459 RepID=G3NWA7_GASAC